LDDTPQHFEGTFLGQRRKGGVPYDE